MIFIGSIPEYELCIKNGYEPLIDWRRFIIDFNLRIDIHQSLFGASNFQLENQKFYNWVWHRKIHNCEETGQPLYNYSSVHVSHIISKGSDRRMAIDPRNCNLLTYNMHNMWENGTEKQRSHMNIYRQNQYIINMLKSEYNVK